MDVLTVPEGHVGRLYAVAVCGGPRVHHGLHIGIGTMNEWIWNLIGITLIAVVVIIWV